VRKYKQCYDCGQTGKAPEKIFYSVSGWAKEGLKMKLKLSVLLLVFIFLAGCNYEFSETPQVEENSNAANVETAKAENNDSVEDEGKPTDESKESSEKDSTTNSTGGEILILEGTGETVAYACNGKEVEVGGTANIINLTGECKKLTVAGVSNKVTVEKVGEIDVSGISNKVTYGEGLDGKKPKISKSGTSTSVDKKETSK
jgi:hypothetical protein